jgi:hypothetical protein
MPPVRKAKSPKAKSLKAKSPKAKSPVPRAKHLAQHTESPVDTKKSPVDTKKSPVDTKKSPVLELDGNTKKDLNLHNAQIKKFENDHVVKELCLFFTKKQKARKEFYKYINGTLGDVFSNKEITGVNMEVLKEEFNDLLNQPADTTAVTMLLKYRDLLVKIPVVDSDLWKSESYVYKNIKVLAYNAFRIVFTADQYKNLKGKKIKNIKNNKKEVIIKCMIKVIDKSNEEELEFLMLETLKNKGCNVPMLYENFETTYFRCYPMEKLDEMILNTKNVNGFNLQETIKIGKGISSILKVIHQLNFFYGDLSLNNIGFLNNEPCLIDFGEVGEIGVNYIINATPRYGSKNNRKNFKNLSTGPFLTGTPLDDYEELGFCLLDIHYWDNSILNNFTEYTEETAISIANTYKNSKKKDPASVFFKKYFTILSNTDNTKIDEAIENLLQKQK